MEYGKSAHYTGERGADYFAWQNQVGQLQATYHCYKFQPYIRPGDEVLDFGCGGGWIVNGLQCRTRKGVEINPVARAHAEALGVETWENLSAISDESVDVVISHHALEHVAEPRIALREVRRVLRSGGKLVVVTPIDDWRNQQDFTGRDRDHHLYTWTPRLMANLFSEAELKPLTAKVISRALFPKAERVQPYLWSPIFDLACFAFSTLTNRREMLSVGQRT